MGGGGPCAFSTDAPASVGQLTAPSSTPQWQLYTLCRSSKCWCQLETGKRARAPRQLGSRRNVRRSRPAGMRRVGANGQARPHHFLAAARPRSWTASRIGRRACSDARVDAGRARQLNGAGDARRTWHTAWTGRRARNGKKKSMQAGAAAAGPIFQRVTHRNRQVNVLVVVASAALAAAVYDAALATSLAASLAAALASAALPAEIVAATCWPSGSRARTAAASAGAVARSAVRAGVAAAAAEKGPGCHRK